MSGGKAIANGRVALWRWVLPVIAALLVAALPTPEGLAPYAWRFFALFVGVVVALVVEPLPSPAVGVVAITLTATLSHWVLFSPQDLANPKFKAANEAAKWAFSGFANPTVWLVGGAFMFALAYEKTGLGKRIALHLVRLLGKSSLLLGYAAVLSDTILAPATPSNTARGGGTMYPIMVNLPPIYGSYPHDPSSRKIGGYLLWTTFAADCLTSSLFMTGCAPNFLARDFASKLAHVEIDFQRWLLASAPFAIPLLFALPLIGYWFYPPEIKKSPEVPHWAADQLKSMGPLSRNEKWLAAFVGSAIILWIFAGQYLEGAIVAFLVVSAMLVTGVLSWDEMVGNKAAWTTIVLLATLVSMADGLNRVGFIHFFAEFVASHLSGFSPSLMLALIVAVYFYSHYFFSSLTAHTTAMMPVMISVGLKLPGMAPDKLVMGLALTTGIMGVISPYATGGALPFYNSGYIPTVDFWRNGLIYGTIFVVALIGIALPLL